MMRVTLRQLSTFEAVARLKSFSRAADEMCVSQPTVSKQIKALSDEVGLPLIEQLGKKIFLTEAGQTLYETCTEWLDTWGRFEQSIARLKGMKQGRLRIAAVTTAKYFMPRILGHFCAEFPEIDIRLGVLNRDQIVERMSHNEDDLYIMGLPPEDMEVESSPILDNPLVVLAPASHVLAGKGQIPFERLGREFFLVREQGSGTRITVERIFAERHVRLKVRMELGSNEAIKQAVAGGLGLAVLSRSTLSLDPIQQDLAILDVEGFPIKRAWYVVWPRHKQLSVVAEYFVEYLHENLEKLLAIHAQPGAGSSDAG